MKKEFNISSEIYSVEKVKEAIIDFEDVAKITFEWDILSIEWEKDFDIEETFNEFMNYVIWLINE